MDILGCGNVNRIKKKKNKRIKLILGLSWMNKDVMKVMKNQNWIQILKYNNRIEPHEIDML